MAKDRKIKDPLAPRATKVTKPAAKASKPIAKSSAAKVFKSADLITASDDEDDDDTDVTPANAVKIAPRVLSSAPETEDDAESDSDDSEEDDAAASKDAYKQRIEQLAQRDDSDDEDPTGEMNADDDDDDDDDNDHDTADTEPTTNGRIHSDEEAEGSQIRPSVAFKPPSGFRVVQDDAVYSKTVDMFHPKQLKGKEVWYISAPASLPITALKEIPFDKITKQRTVLDHEDENYTILSDATASKSTHVLLPQQGSGYKAAPMPVTQVLQFQQATSIQTTASKGRPKTTSQVLLDTDLPTKPNKRPQPAGMKMRYRPAGFGEGDLGVIGSSDEEAMQSTATFRHVPALESTSKSSSKRKDDASLPGLEGKSKKSKKNKESTTAQEAAHDHAAYVQEATVAIDAAQDTAPPEAKSAEGKKKKKRDRKGVEIATGLEPVDEPMNGEVISGADISALVEVADKTEKKKKKKDRHSKDVDDDTRAINHSAMELDATGSAVDEEAERRKRKKEKKEKKEKKLKA